jgi:uncharacterized protein YjbI with pentapeptide repeats
VKKGDKNKNSWQERRKKISKRWKIPFLYAEWRCEQLANLLERWAFLDILGHVGRLGILLSIVTSAYFYVTESNERKVLQELMRAEYERQQAVDQKKIKHYQAWQIINTASGKPGGGGRISALQDLNQDAISLGGIDISNAYLPGLDLEGADLTRANMAAAFLVQANLAKANLRSAALVKADLTDANLVKAELGYANLAEAYIRGTDLTDANLFNVDLTRAVLYRANFEKAHIEDANLAEANLSLANLVDADLKKANLIRASLFGADLTRASFEETNLSGVDLRGANLTEANLWHNEHLLDIEGIELANIYKVKNPPKGFIKWAMECFPSAKVAHANAFG